MIPPPPETATCADASPDSDELNFRSFFEATLAPLQHYLSRIIGHTDAKDVAQNAFVRVHAAMQENSLEKPQAYLYVTARRLALDELRRRRADPLHQTDESTLEGVISSSPGVEHVAMARQELDQLMQEIEKLPPGCRTVLLLSRLENLPHQQIANKLGIAYSTVEKQHARALRLLKQSCRAADSNANDVAKPSSTPNS